MANNKRLTRIQYHEEVIKKSLFIGICSPIDSVDAFETFLSQHNKADATHNCWAYRINQQYRFNDDGEPSGTAGKPILAAIDGAGFDGVAALVIRHYGGIKLGTGGLARAYGGVIARNLQQAEFVIHQPQQNLQLNIPFQNEQALHQLLKQQQGQIIEQQYTEQGVNFLIQLPKLNHSNFCQRLNDISKGQASIIIKNKET